MQPSRLVCPPKGEVLKSTRFRFGQVTGITTNAEGTMSKVEFDWSVEPTALWAQVSPGARAETLQGSADFQLYDDGWRLMNLEAEAR